MSDFANIRSRRRIPDHQSYSTVVDFEVHDPDPDQKSHKPNNAYSHTFSTVFNASASQLWNSAQEALASTYETEENANNNVGNDRYSEALDSLSIYGSPLDHIVITMPSRDRTSEFKATAKSFEMKAAANGIRPQQKHELLAESVQFNQLAKRIGRELSQTCAKMEKLAEFAKKKSLYENRAQIDHLSGIVKSDITGLNKQIGALQEFSKRRAAGSSKNQNNGHSQLVVVGLQSKLANVSKDFQSVLEISTETMKSEKNRRDRYSNTAQVGLPSSSSGTNVRSKLLQDDEQHGSSSIALDMGSLDNFQTQHTMQQRDTSLEYAQARNNTMATIEGSISELGQIFSQLASLVSEQGEMITRIDSNVEDTALNIDMAHSELVRYLQNISKNRWLMIQVFGVLMVFFVVFVLFLT
uniref:t-SNARE coiled-coil homology domain-containing protein n=1 Tax=Caenorhabditis japonica TaxID=281687 RepID=A0A8R1DN96_CAEJA